jgi:hypothetical protein
MWCISVLTVIQLKTTHTSVQLRIRLFFSEHSLAHFKDHQFRDYLIETKGNESCPVLGKTKGWIDGG